MGTKVVSTKLMETSTLDISLNGYPFRIQTRINFISERKKQGVKLGDGKGNKTLNELDKIKELKNQN